MGEWSMMNQEGSGPFYQTSFVRRSRADCVAKWDRMFPHRHAGARADRLFEKAASLRQYP